MTAIIHVRRSPLRYTPHADVVSKSLYSLPPPLPLRLSIIYLFRLVCMYSQSCICVRCVGRNSKQVLVTGIKDMLTKNEQSATLLLYTNFVYVSEFEDNILNIYTKRKPIRNYTKGKSKCIQQTASFYRFAQITNWTGISLRIRRRLNLCVV